MTGEDTAGGEKAHGEAREDGLPEGVTRQSFDGEPVLATRGPPIGDEPVADGWRRWAPERSKLGAMLDLGMEVPLGPDSRVLYLGAASGTTVSHVADVASPTYAVEFAPRPARELLDVAADRPNLIPLLKDARRPSSYAHVVESNLDLLVQDVATRGQARVAVENARFLAPDGRVAMAVKARSEDVTADPRAVFDACVEALEPTYEVLDRRSLESFHRDHEAILATPTGE